MAVFLQKNICITSTCVRDVRPWFDTLFEYFGVERVIWGSDWPVLNQVGNYRGWLNQCKSYCNQLADQERQKVFSGNATRIYKL